MHAPKSNEKIVVGKSDINNKQQEYLNNIYQVGKANYDTGNYKQALTIFRFLCLLSPSNHDFFLALASTQIKMKNIDKAICSLTYASTLKDSDPRALLLLAQTFLEQRNLDMSYQSATKVVEICSHDLIKWKLQQQMAKNILQQIKIL